MTHHQPSRSPSTPRLVIGAMTGTSLDGIDAALLSIDGHGPQMHARVLRSFSRDLGDLAAPLRAASEGQPLPASRFAELALSLGQLYADTCSQLASRDRIHLAGVHGQTLHHAPPLSLQLIEPAPIARALACPVWFNPRQADLASGGQGAPITPAADQILYASPDEPRAVVNLGGFCNITLLDPNAPTQGFDLCACNQLLDGLARTLLNKPYDNDGATAASGAPHAQSTQQLSAMLEAQRNESRSLGTGDELTAAASSLLSTRTPADALNTATEALAQVIAGACAGHKVLLAGGGAKNTALVSAITKHADRQVTDAGDFGPTGADREPAAIAVLAALAADGHPVTLQSVTGREQNHAPDGCWAGVSQL